MHEVFTLLTIPVFSGTDIMVFRETRDRADPAFPDGRSNVLDVELAGGKKHKVKFGKRLALL